MEPVESSPEQLRVSAFQYPAPVRCVFVSGVWLLMADRHKYGELELLVSDFVNTPAWITF